MRVGVKAVSGEVAPFAGDTQRGAVYRRAMRRRITTSALALLACVAGACGAPQGTHIRLAHASNAELDAAGQSGEVVWYDFEAGDEVPLQFGLLGVARAATDQPSPMIAQRPFSVVVFPDGRTFFSFDGSSLTPGNQAARWSFVVGSDVAGGRAGLLLFIGQQQDLPPELQR